jgi:hypothetical protein
MTRFRTAVLITALNSDPAGRCSASLHVPFKLVRMPHVPSIFLTYIYLWFVLPLGRAHSATGEHVVRT